MCQNVLNFFENVLKMKAANFKIFKDINFNINVILLLLFLG